MAAKNEVRGPFKVTVVVEGATQEVEIYSRAGEIDYDLSTPGLGKLPAGSLAAAISAKHKTLADSTRDIFRQMNSLADILKKGVQSEEQKRSGKQQLKLELRHPCGQGESPGADPGEGPDGDRGGAQAPIQD